MGAQTNDFLVYKPHLLGHDGRMSNGSTPISGFDFAGLSNAERILLAGELLDMAYSPMPALTAEQIDDLERYDAEADAGRVMGEAWEVVKARLKQRG